VELDAKVPTVLILLRPNAMVARRESVCGLCDLDEPKLLYAVSAGVFLDKGGDGEVDGEKALGLDASLSKAPDGDVGSGPGG
jgi:hypothetical protein